jgi:extradiol dioxygenase family protein
MIKVTELAFCCYTVSDINRAREFYEGALGLKESCNIENRWIEYEFGPHTLALNCTPGMFAPSADGCAAALEVEDFDAAVKHLREKKIKFRMEPTKFPQCRMCMVYDPDGNTITIHKRNSK